MREAKVRVEYLHSDIDAIERVEILRNLRLGNFDVLVGINLLREGLDLPEVALVAILDADKEGFLRSETSLIQTAGRAARHEDGRVIFYADNLTESIKRTQEITLRRRERQIALQRRAWHHPAQCEALGAIEPARLRRLGRKHRRQGRRGQPGRCRGRDRGARGRHDRRGRAAGVRARRAAARPDQRAQVRRLSEVG